MAGVDAQRIHQVFGFEVFDGTPRKQLGGNEQENKRQTADGSHISGIERFKTSWLARPHTETLVA
jgi:hypothetical protein